MPILRGEIYFMHLGPTHGRELDSKRRPVAVLSVNGINSKPLVVVVVPGTSLKASRPLFVNEARVDPTAENGLASTTLFQCHQIKAVDHARFTAGPVGTLAVADLEAIEQAVKVCLGLP